MHTVISPPILYWGTPVVLIATTNPDGSFNIGPMSSAWWLGHRCVLGLDGSSQTTINLLRTKECTLNLPSENLIMQVNALARTTGTDPVGPGKLARGYIYVKDKFNHAGLTPVSADDVKPALIQECPVQMEASLAAVNELMEDLPDHKGLALVLEVKILRVHVDEEIKMAGHANRVDPDKWQPMIMNFQELYGVGKRKLAESVLGKIEEELYRPFTRSDVVRQGGDVVRQGGDVVRQGGDVVRQGGDMDIVSKGDVVDIKGEVNKR